MQIDSNRVYSRGELRILLEKQKKEKEHIEKSATIDTPKIGLQDHEISEKNCIYLSTDKQQVINILERKIMYRNGALWCPDHGDKCIIRSVPTNSYFPAYKCSMQAKVGSPFGMGCGKIIMAGKRTPLFFYNFNADIRKIIIVAALLQFEQKNMTQINKISKDISYQNCITIKEALTRAQIHDTRTLQILQNQWNLFKRYCVFHKLNYLQHLATLIEKVPFIKGKMGRKPLMAETAQPIAFNPPRQQMVIENISVPLVRPFVSPLTNNLSIQQASESLIKAIEEDINKKHQTLYDELNSYKEDALKYRKMVQLMKE